MLSTLPAEPHRHREHASRSSAPRRWPTVGRSRQPLRRDRSSAGMSSLLRGSRSAVGRFSGGSERLGGVGGQDQGGEEHGRASSPVQSGPEQAELPRGGPSRRAQRAVRQSVAVIRAFVGRRRRGSTGRRCTAGFDEPVWRPRVVRLASTRVLVILVCWSVAAMFTGRRGRRRERSPLS